MADNVGYTPGSGATIAADDIGGALYQRVKMIHGADGIAHETADGNPLPVYLRDSAATTSFGPITSSNTVLFSAVEMSNEKSVSLQLGGLWDGAIYLQQSNDDVTWFDVQGISQNNSGGLTSTIYAPDLVTIHTVARYFRAITSLDFTGTVSGSYAARAIQPPILQQDVRLAEIADDVRVHMFARDRNGYSMGLRTNPFGGLLVADNEPVTGNLNRLGPVVQLETTGYNSVSVQASGQWLVPAIGRFFRAQVTTYTSGMAVVVAVLKNQNAWQPQSTPSVTIASNSAVNVSQIGGTTPVTAGVAGMLAVGGNIAEDTAATSNPLICGGVARTSLPASTVIAGDAIRQTFSVSGQLVTKLNAPADLDFYVNATVTTNTQTALRAAQASPIRQNVTSLTFQNTNATATTLTIQDGSTTLITFSVPASMTLPVQLDFPTPLRGTAATALNYTAGTTGANVLLNVTGFNSY